MMNTLTDVVEAKCPFCGHKYGASMEAEGALHVVVPGHTPTPEAPTGCAAYDDTDALDFLTNARLSREN